MYTFTDKILSSLTRRILRLFRKIRLLNLDELNVVNQVSAVYRQADKLARNAYFNIAEKTYRRAFEEALKAGFNGEKGKISQRSIDDSWITDVLEKPDTVTLYDYELEWERKKQRLVEALAASAKPQREIDKAERYLLQQISHYADKITVTAVLEAFEDTGVKKVMWITEKDEKVCGICQPLDDRIFDIDKVPQIPAHYRCRCTIVPVR